jgi:hypothetical protein
MPVNNVNAEALRIVTNAAKGRIWSIERDIQEDESDCHLGIGCQEDLDKTIENLERLRTSVWMMEQHIERFDNEQ